ncbi:MAG: DNA polymerase III subunit beta [Patescibacteria group bacterium]|nr:DNA polymerase III subunit beta [Patescibacteria group bacterium]
MNINILKEKLKEGVNIVAKISQKSLTLPVLQNTLLKTEKNFLKLSTTNLESAISWWSLAKIEKEGQVCIPTRFLSNLLGFLPNKPLTLNLDGLSLDLECDNYKTKIKALSSEDFPIIPQLKEGEVITIDNNIFCQALNQVLNIPSSSVTRPEISGIFFSFQKDLIKMVATDSFRLAEKKIFLKNNLEKEYSLILPQNAAKEIINIFGEKQGDLKIIFSPNQILFEYMMSETDHPQIQFISKLIEGEYPNYQEIIPKKYETQILVKKDDFLNQIKAASLFSGKINEVRLKANPKNGKMEVLSQSADFGEYNSFFNGKIKGKELGVSFNHRFLIDGIAEMKEKELSFELTSEEGPAVLKPLTGKDYLYVIMPIKAS